MTWPGAVCELRSPAVPGDRPLQVFGDEIGLTQFGAIKAAPGDPVTTLSLDCHDDSGRAQSFPIDLTSADTFRPLPAAVKARPNDEIRPPLKGDPMQYSREELIKQGFGPRPDPAKAPSLYATWLRLSSMPASRHHGGTKPLAYSATMWATIDEETNPPWAGGVFTEPNLETNGSTGSGGYYMLAEWDIESLKFPGTTSSSADTDFWAGLGGFVAGSDDLIQEGVFFSTNSTSVVPHPFIEYWSGPGVGGTCYSTACWFGTPPTPQAGDTLYGAVWPCDSMGNNGPSYPNSTKYACFFWADQHGSNVYLLDATTPATGSLSAINTYKGATGEAIVERGNTGTDQVADFGTQNIEIELEDSWFDYQSYGGSPTSIGDKLILQNSASQTLVNVTLDYGSDQLGTLFTWEQGQ